MVSIAGKVLGAIATLAFLTLAIWSAVAGPRAVLRIIRYGDTTIDDFTHYPGRRLRASDSPHQFERRTGAFDLAASVLPGDRVGGDLGWFLESNDSIAFMVLQGNTVLYERTFQGQDVSTPSQLFSVSKSFTSALIGMAIDDGIMEHEDQLITDYVPELKDRGFHAVTIHHLLTMMSGSSYVESDNPFGEHVILNYTPRLRERILAFTTERPPGEQFRYKSGDSALLALALDRALGAETISQFAERRLWKPLGMADDGVWTVDHQGDGLEKTWCCLAASARDVAKLGRLYLQNGSWDGRQILSSDWIAQSTRGQVPDAAWPGDYQTIGWWSYGYQWWLASQLEEDFFALGKDGQFLYVNPTHDVVIVRLGRSAGEVSSSVWIALFQTIAGEIGGASL